MLLSDYPVVIDMCLLLNQFLANALIIGPFEFLILPGSNSSSTSNNSLPVAIIATLGFNRYGTCV